MSTFMDRSNELDIIREFAISLLRQNTLEDLCWNIAGNIGRLLDFEDCVIYLRHGNELKQVAAFGVKNPEKRVIDAPISITVGNGIVGTVAETGMAELVPNVTVDPRYIPDKFGGLSELTVPLIYQDQVIGIIDSESSELDGFTRADLRMFQSLADICSSRIASAIVAEKEREAQEALQQSKAMLESRVQERTIELARSIAVLEEKRKELLETQASLNDEKHWLQCLLDTVSDALIATDSNREVRSLSFSASQLLKVDPDEVVGKSIDDLLQVENPPEFSEVITHRKAFVWQRDCLVDGDGKLRQVIIKASPILVDDRIDGILILIADVTRQRFLEREAAKAQRIESLGLLAGGIAHDFNNYLQAIVSGIEGASMTADSESLEHLKISDSACVKAKQLASQLLTFSKSGAPDREVISIGDIVESAVPIVQSGTKSIIRTHLPGNLKNVFVNRPQMEQVIGNLLINADQSMVPGGEINVYVSQSVMPAQKDKAAIRIDVVDQGCGIPAERMDLVFEPYFSTKPEGSGLGLTTSYFIIRRHGGELQIHSRETQGTTASIFLPTTTRKAVSEDKSKSTSRTPRKRRVLLMDDDLMVRKSIGLLLDKFGFDVVETVDFDSTIAAFLEAKKTANDFDMAILDLSIDGVPVGTQAMKKLRELDSNIKGLLTTGFCHDEVATCYHDYGFSGILRKPFKSKELLSAIELAFDCHQAMK